MHLLFNSRCILLINTLAFGCGAASQPAVKPQSSRAASQFDGPITVASRRDAPFCKGAVLKLEAADRKLAADAERAVLLRLGRNEPDFSDSSYFLEASRAGKLLYVIADQDFSLPPGGPRYARVASLTELQRLADGQGQALNYLQLSSAGAVAEPEGSRAVLIGYEWSQLKPRSAPQSPTTVTMSSGGTEFCVSRKGSGLVFYEGTWVTSEVEFLRGRRSLLARNFSSMVEP